MVYLSPLKIINRKIFIVTDRFHVHYQMKPSGYVCFSGICQQLWVKYRCENVILGET